MSESSFVNTLSLPENLSAAEQKFVDCMKAGAPCEFDKAEQSANANVISGDVISFFALGGNKDDQMGSNIIGLQGARISGGLNLAHVRTTYSLVFVGCHFAERIMMPHSAFHFLNLNGSLLKGGLVGDGMKIASDILLNKGFTSEGEVGLVSADIGGDLDCSSGQFKNKEGVAINAHKIKARGGVRIGEGLYAEGEVSLISADIGTELFCDGGKFVNKGQDAFCADNMKVSGSVFMREDFCAKGKVRLLGATISGDWYCNGGNFQNEGRQALVADRVRVGGNLQMHDGFSAKGEVRLSGAHIKGIVSCRGGIFDNKKGKKIPEFGTNAALVAQGTKIDSNLLLTSGFSADGMVVLHNAKIGDSVICNGVTFAGDVVMDSAKIGNSLFWTNVGGKGECNLSFASAEVFDYDEKSLHGFKFILDGFSYKGFAERKNVESRLNWLRGRPARKDFAPQPFEQAAKVLFAMGYNNDARKVLLEKERLLTQKGQFGKWHKHLRQWWDYLAGYGYEWWKTLKKAAFVIGFGWAVFFAANCLGYIVPHQPLVMVQVETAMKNDKHKCAGKHPTEVAVCLLPQYPRFHSLAYSADVFIPFFALHQEQYWYPQPRREGNNFALFYVARGIFTAVLWFEIIAGWILTSLFVLTITGLLKPRQSSLE